ncbi:SEC-C metal-binding domain-containing protein [Pseudovibrio sp. FO-BEG1]|uniref:SEC-C metal-binding domain-containing protein n=1 Tax=Pseudovibrio sp. (strain FO-BEG1) TaxID=911045 RepID=UPI0005A12DCB|nr:SEC-C domain-containing protein [Pseudovibrio sp. FO-BEG1]
MVRRNQQCPCGSGKRYKHCHGNLADLSSNPNFVNYIQRRRREVEADNVQRQNQQGLGRPIIAVQHKDHQIVAVKNELHFSKSWKTFPDFLSDYIKKTIGSEWGNAELAKPENERHQIIKWYQSYCLYQQKAGIANGNIHSTEVTGLVICYLGLAYNLYLL